MRIHQMEDIWQLQYPGLLQKYCVVMTKMKNKPMVQDIGINLCQLVKAFAQEEARYFDVGYWLMLIHEGSNKMRIEYCKDNNGSPCYLQAVHQHSANIPIGPELMDYTLIPYKWKEYIYHRGISWNCQSMLTCEIILGGKADDRARQSVFFTPLNPFGNDPKEEDRHFDYTVPQKGHYETYLKCNQDAVCCINLSRAQDIGFRFSQTKSFAI